MNYTKSEKELNSVRPDLVQQYFAEKTAVPGAKIHLLAKLKNYPEKKVVQPVSHAYFKNNFSHLCSNYPEVVISIMKVGKEEPDHLVQDLRKSIIDKEINWNNLSIITIANAEAIFQRARKEVYDIVTEEDKSKIRIENVLRNIKHLAGAEPYNDIRRIYWMLYCELRVVLQFHKPDSSWKLFFTIGEHPEHWFKLRGEKDVPALKYLSEHSIEEYEIKPGEFRKGLLSAIKGDCVSEDTAPPPEIDEPKPQLYDTKYRNHLILIPKLPANKEHRNSMIWYDNNGKEHSEEDKIGNDPFDFLYYLAWLYKNGNQKGMLYSSSIPKEDIIEIIADQFQRNRLRRFETKWATGDEHQKNTKKSVINGYFKFDLIIKIGAHFQLNDSLSVELRPYPDI